MENQKENKDKVLYIKYSRKIQEKSEDTQKKIIFKWKFKINKQCRSIKLIDKPDKIKLIYYGISDKQKFEFEKEIEIINLSVQDEVLKKIDFYFKRDYFEFKCKINKQKYQKPVQKKDEDELFEWVEDRVRDRLERYGESLDTEFIEQLDEQLPEDERKGLIKNILISHSRKAKINLEDTEIRRMIKMKNVFEADHRLADLMLERQGDKQELEFDEILKQLTMNNDVESHKHFEDIIMKCKKVRKKKSRYAQIQKLEELKLTKKEPKIFNHERNRKIIEFFTNAKAGEKYEESVKAVEEGIAKVKSKIMSPVKTKVLAKICRAVEIYFGYQLRRTQLVAIVTILMKDCSLPRILEVKTGEGKTLIIQCIALYKVIEGVRVDVTTSNVVLAKEGAEETKKFFEHFGFTVDFLKDDDEAIDQINGKKEYTVDVLYGTAHQFCSDILGEHNSLMNIRNGRAKNYMIIDEVDSMMLDSVNYRTIISNVTDRCELTDTLKEKIWYTLLAFVSTEIDPEAERNKICEAILNEIKHFLQMQKGRYSSKKIEQIRLKSENWVDSAWQALFYMKKNVDYSVSRDQLGVRKKSS